MSPITNCIKGGKFEWTTQAQKAFDELKQKMCNAPIMGYLILLNLLKLNVMPVEQGLAQC